MSDAEALVRYEPSGRVGAGVVVALTVALAVSALIGIGYEFALEANPFVLLNPLLTLTAGFAGAGAGFVALRFGKVRKRRIAIAVAWLLAITVLGAAWWTWLRTTPGAEPRPGAELLVFVWPIEAAVLLAAAVAVPLAWWNRAVFCEEDDRFVRRRKLASGYGPTPFALREVAAREGVDGVLSGIRCFAANAVEGEFRFWLHETRSDRYVTVFWHGRLEGVRGKRVTRDILVLRRVLVDQSWIDRLKGICA